MSDEVLSFTLDIFTEEPQDGYCAIHGLIRNKRVVRYFPTKYLELNPIFSKYKVLVPEANGSGAIGEVLSTQLIGEPLIGEPLIGFTGSYIAIGQFTSIENANVIASTTGRKRYKDLWVSTLLFEITAGLFCGAAVAYDSYQRVYGKKKNDGFSFSFVPFYEPINKDAGFVFSLNHPL